MTLYKYMPPDSALRFLSTWALRLTPPDAFNDPFEMRPPVDLITDEILSRDSLREELTKRIAEDFVTLGFQVQADSPWVKMFTSHLMGELSAKQERLFIEMTPVQARSKLKTEFPVIRKQFNLFLAQAYEQLPAFNEVIQHKLHETIPKTIGALCMSRNGRHPLMWAHYASEHRGAVIGFNDMAPCFNRKRSTSDEVGLFRKVIYSESRPRLDTNSGDEWFQILALTKAAEWAYEEEMRFLLPLTASDRVVNDSIHLLSVPPAVVESIILGCRATDVFVANVRQQLREIPEASHILAQKAEVDPNIFVLNYHPVSI